MSGKTKYACRYCKAEKWIPEKPMNAPEKIQTGCQGACARITPHHPVGRPYEGMKLHGNSRR